MKTNLDQIKATIKQCFAVAENDASCDSEIEQALRVANLYLARYNLERDDVFTSDDGEVNVDNVAYGRREVYTMNQNMAYWEADLACFVAKFVGTCQFYRSTGCLKTNHAGMVTGRAVRFTFYGPTDDAQFCVELFEAIAQHAVSVAILKFGKRTGFMRGDGAAYCEGFVAGLRKQHVHEVEKLRQHSDSKALIEVSEQRTLAIRNGATQWLVESEGVKLSKGRGGGSSCGHRKSNCFDTGKQDGASYSLPNRKAGHIA